MADISKPYKILFLRLDPGSKDNRALQGEELARIYSAIAKSRASNLFDVKDSDKSTLSEIIVDFVEFDPDIVHLSGHGTKNALLMPNYSNTENEEAKNSTFLSQADLDSFFGCILGLGGTKPRILFINACLAGAAARQISQNMKGHANCIIGMTNVLNQKLALDFTTIFYTSLAKGNTVSCILDDFNSAITAAQISLQQDEAGFNPEPRAYGNLEIKFKAILSIAIEEIQDRDLNLMSPYKGLKKFKTEDSDCFFGRDQFIEQLINDLENSNFVLLLGASGSGKSSVILAGLIPQLQEKWGNRFVKLIFAPDRDPFESLYRSLANEDYSQAEAEIARTGNDDTLIQVLKSLKRPDDFWLIFIDQFEELFTISDTERRDRFIKSLVKLGQVASPTVKIVSTMRADFLDRLSHYPTLVNLTNGHRPLIAEMQEDELRLAIEQPAALHGVVFETGLVEEIIKGVQGQAGYLPLLQYTLDLLWKAEVDNKEGGIQNRTLNTASYRRLGGVRGSLQQRVDQIYGTLSESEQLAVQRIFLKLVEIGGDANSGTEWKPVRRRALRSEFTDETEQIVLSKLINANLLVSDVSNVDSKSDSSPRTEATVEIAHEILLTSWATLNDWIKQNRQAIALRSRLNDDVAIWQTKKAESDLWSGSKLTQALELRQDPIFKQVLGGFSVSANQFIDASVELRDRQRRRAVLGLSGFSAMALLLVCFALYQLQRAERRRVEQLTATAKALLATQPAEAQVYALASLHLSQSAFVQFPDHPQFPSVEDSLLNTIQGNWERNRLIHKDVVWSAAFSPNGEQIVSGSQDGKIQLWDAKTGKPIWEEPLVVGLLVRSVAFSPNGEQIVSGSQDGKIQLWDAKTGKPIGEPLQDHTAAVRSVAFSRDGKQIVSGSQDGKIQLWNAKTGKPIGEPLQDHALKVYSVSFSPNGEQVASGSQDGTVRLWDTKTGKLERALQGHTRPVWSVTFSRNGKQVASGSQDGTVRLWDTKTGKLERVLQSDTEGTSAVYSVSFSPAGETVISGSWDGKVRLRSVTDGALKRVFQGHRTQVYSVAFSPDGKQIVSSGEDKTVRLWTVPTQNLVAMHLPPKRDVDIASVTFSRDGQQIVSGSQDGTVRLWDAKTSKSIRELPWQGYKKPVISIALSPDGKQIAFGGDKTIQVWNLEKRQLSGRSPEGLTSKITSIAFSPSGETVVSGSQDGTVQVWNVETGNPIGKPFKQHNQPVRFVAFSPDDRRILSGSSDSIYFHNVESNNVKNSQLGEQLYSQLGKSLVSVALSPHGKRVAVGSQDNGIWLWNIETNQQIEIPLQGHQAQVTSIAFSPDGKRIISGDNNGMMRLWDAETRQPIGQPLQKHEVTITSVAFSPNGKQVVSGNTKEDIKVWDVAPERWLQIACQQLQYNSILETSTDIYKEAKVTCQPMWSKQ